QTRITRPAPQIHMVGRVLLPRSHPDKGQGLIVHHARVSITGRNSTRRPALHRPEISHTRRPVTVSHNQIPPRPRSRGVQLNVSRRRLRIPNTPPPASTSSDTHRPVSTRSHRRHMPIIRTLHRVPSTLRHRPRIIRVINRALITHTHKCHYLLAFRSRRPAANRATFLVVTDAN